MSFLLHNILHSPAFSTVLVLHNYETKQKTTYVKVEKCINAGQLIRYLAQPRLTHLSGVRWCEVEVLVLTTFCFSEKKSALL